MKNIKIGLVLGFTFLLIINGCKKDEPTFAPSNLSYSDSLTTVTSGVSITLSAPMIEGTGTITYSISSSPSTNEISIDSSTGEIIVSNSVAVGEYAIIVTASNSEGSTTTNYVIIVEEINAPPSQLTYANSSISIPEGSSWSSDLPGISGTRPIVFTLVSLPISSDISIDSLTGVISCSENIVADNYSLTITATNSQGSTSTTYSISITETAALVSFEIDIKPIVSNNCGGCHTGGGQTDYRVYSNASSNINSFINRINREQGSSGFMPQGGAKLSQAELNLVQKWLDDGLQP